MKHIHTLEQLHPTLLTHTSPATFSNVVSGIDLEHGVREKQAVSDVVQEFGAGAADGIELEDLLGRFRLPSSTLP